METERKPVEVSSMRSLLARIRYFHSVLHNTLGLDIWDLNYTYSNPRALKRYIAIGSDWPTKLGLLPRIMSFFFHMVEGFGHILTIKSPPITPGAILLFAITQNQTNSLSPLLAQLENCYLVKDRHKVREGVLFPACWAYLLSLFFLPLLLYQFWSKRRQLDTRAIGRYRFDGYWLAYGYYVVTRLWLHKVRPAAVIVSNDHSMECRVWNKAAREENIPTFYLQHAAVSEEFPPLSFDYALLDGIDAFELYEHIGPSTTQVYLVGNVKHDRYFPQINTNTIAKSAGICTSILDPIESAATVCQGLRSAFPEHVFRLRPHPGDKRFEEWRKVATEYTMEFSDPKLQNSYDFLQSVDAIIAGSTSIHIEAALLNVYPIFYNFSQNSMFQVYTFLERNLCDNAQSPDEILSILTKLTQCKPNIRERAKPYCATIHTAFDGRAHQLVKGLLESLVTTGAVSYGNWQRLHGYSLTGYQLADPSEGPSR